MAQRPSGSGEMRTPMSPSFWMNMSMWSGRAPSTVISPPATATRGEVGGGLDAVGHDGVLDAAELAGLDALDR